MCGAVFHMRFLAGTAQYVLNFILRANNCGWEGYMYLFKAFCTLIRCEKVDFPYISMESAVFRRTATIFNTKQLFFVQLNQDLTYLKQ